MSGTIPVAVAPPPTRVPRLRSRERRELAVLLRIVTVLTVAGWTLLAAVAVWAAAVAYWKLAGVERRWRSVSADRVPH